MIRVVSVRGIKGEARKGVCYVGREFAGWPWHPLGNPFKPMSKPPSWQGEWWPEAIQECLKQYRNWLLARPVEVVEKRLKELWDECDQGNKPLGCWCINSVYGDGQPVICHAQILAGMLHERFAIGEAEKE